MDKIFVEKINEKYHLSGSTILIKEKIKKYGFTWDSIAKKWIGNSESLEILIKYINNFKTKIEIINK